MGHVRNKRVFRIQDIEREQIEIMRRINRRTWGRGLRRAERVGIDSVRQRLYGVPDNILRPEACCYTILGGLGNL